MMTIEESHQRSTLVTNHADSLKVVPKLTNTNDFVRRARWRVARELSRPCTSSSPAKSPTTLP